jgi:hypothetical protein
MMEREIETPLGTVRVTEDALPEDEQTPGEGAGQQKLGADEFGSRRTKELEEYRQESRTQGGRQEPEGGGEQQPKPHEPELQKPEPHKPSFATFGDGTYQVGRT